MPGPMVEIGPYLVTPETWFWMRAGAGIYAFVGVLVAIAVANSEMDLKGPLRATLSGVIHGALWPVYALLFLLYLVLAGA